MNLDKNDNHLMVKLNFQKESAFHVGFREYKQAIIWSTGKREYGGCFEEVLEGYIAYWLPKDHPRISKFTW